VPDLAGRSVGLEQVAAAFVHYVHSFEELIHTPYPDGVNALCWQRDLPGSYSELLDLLPLQPGINSIEDADILALEFSVEGRLAARQVLADLELLRQHDLDPVLDAIHGYVEAGETGVIPTNVRSWHVDSATAKADTYLCTYHGASSQALAPGAAIRRCDIPETRAAMLAEFGGKDDAEFEDYLAACCYDLHYLPLPGTKPVNFGVGNMWRIAVQWPGSETPASVHRAPEPEAGRMRLLLIA
jgi:hypothetical protein